MDEITAMIVGATFDESDWCEIGTYSLYRDAVGFVCVYEWRDNVPVLIREQKR